MVLESKIAELERI